MIDLVQCPKCGSDMFRFVNKLSESEIHEIYRVGMDGVLECVDTEEVRPVLKEVMVYCLSCLKVFETPPGKTIEEYLISLNLSEPIKEKSGS